MEDYTVHLRNQTAKIRAWNCMSISKKFPSTPSLRSRSYLIHNTCIFRTISHHDISDHAKYGQQSVNYNKLKHLAMHVHNIESKRNISTGSPRRSCLTSNSLIVPTRRHLPTLHFAAAAAVAGTAIVSDHAHSHQDLRDTALPAWRYNRRSEVALEVDREVGRIVAVGHTVVGRRAAVGSVVGIAAAAAAAVAADNCHIAIARAEEKNVADEQEDSLRRRSWDCSFRCCSLLRCWSVAIAGRMGMELEIAFRFHW